jgi:hypothetical protein
MEEKVDVKVSKTRYSELDILAIRLDMLARGNGFLKELLGRFVLVVEHVRVFIKPIGNQAIP